MSPKAIDFSYINVTLVETESLVPERTNFKVSSPIYGRFSFNDQNMSRYIIDAFHCSILDTNDLERPFSLRATLLHLTTDVRRANLSFRPYRMCKIRLSPADN